jgi:predicted O-methyltransferase YrrM
VSRLFIVKEYLQYIAKAKNLHGIHSPFVYTFNDEVLNDDRSFYAFEKIETLRKQLLKDSRKIEVTDFGAGSHTTKSNIRTIKSIAKNAGKRKKHAELLFKIINYYQRNNILELGTSLGIGTSYMASGNGSANITTLEGCPNISKEAKHNFQSLGLENIDIVTGEFSTTLPLVLQSNNAFDFVFLDGNHQYKATLQYLNTILPYLSKDAIVVLDDIHWSDGMAKAWQEIVADTRFDVTIDLFQFGIIFFSDDFKEKQHFVLKGR